MASRFVEQILRAIANEDVGHVELTYLSLLCRPMGLTFDVYGIGGFGEIEWNCAAPNYMYFPLCMLF